MNSVIITGATGFVGSHITEYFLKKKVEVGCIARKSSDLSAIKGLPVEINICDISDLIGITKATKGYDCVIHNCAKACDWGDYQDFYNTNVEGTLNVLQACKVNGITNVVLTGSISVYGEENWEKVKDESFPYNSHYKYFLDSVFPCAMNYYRDTKAIAQEKAINYARENNLNLTVINPVWVYGEREFNTGFYDYTKTASSGIMLFPGSSKNNFHVIYAKDLARFFYLTYKKQLKGVNVFIAGNEKVEKMDKIFGLFCKEAGVKKPYNIPKVLVYPLAFLLELLYTFFESKKPPLLTRGRVNMFYDNIEYSVKKAEEILGFKNEYSLEEGIRKTIQWYKKEKLL